jgi:DNA-binding MarR family transcriptional regulator
MTLAWAAFLPPSMKLVLMALADIANDEGICWPSVRLLARKCSLSDRTVRGIIADLEAKGFIRIERRFRTNGSQASNRYEVLTERGERSAGGWKATTKPEATQLSAPRRAATAR